MPPSRRVRRASRRTLLLIGPALLVAVGGCGADEPASAPPAAQPTDAPVPNIDAVRQQIREYYGDPGGTGRFAADSAYADQVARLVDTAEDWLADRADRETTGRKAVLLDVDDTSLNTYNYQHAANFTFDQTKSEQFTLGQLFPAVPGMAQLSQRAAASGYAVFYLTGRGAVQEQATLGNLTADGVGVDAGFAAPTPLSPTVDGLFTRPAPADYPDYLTAACGGSPCTTVQYKSATRAYIESQGYDIVANFGDQQSDLTGGSADRTFKLPNPMYTIP